MIRVLAIMLTVLAAGQTLIAILAAYTAAITSSATWHGADLIYLGCVGMIGAALTGVAALALWLEAS